MRVFGHVAAPVVKSAVSDSILFTVYSRSFTARSSLVGHSYADDTQVYIVLRALLCQASLGASSRALSRSTNR